ncbi:glycosyltransferase family 2 protein [Paracoccus sp. MC1862]|uniref:glycosyltransferase family 2 protein n=1 Tax=Paracoccus sp. MC1862 TaxID=2760307 RepID=UPI00190D0BB5|nr:glycosyltransferase family 2 protein [Paracoccus sp. MC1862]QQO46760.1 glycosyltransferase family 2 protein [Paracoccus sp. MC1862]
MSGEFHLSVVIPNRNRAHSLARAVLSVRDDDAGAEIIVVDDCSDEDLSAEYARLQAMGVRVLRQDSRRRGGAARNRGVREAGGTHVSFLDSDDVWLPGRHDHIRRFYAAPGRDRTVLVSGALLHIDGDIRRPHQPDWRPGRSLVEYCYRDGGRVQTSMLSLPAGIARAHPFDEDLRVNQDTDLAMRMDRAGIAFHIDPEPGVIKEESPRPDRLTTGAETADLSFAWYRRESGDWSPAARSGYFLQDRVWRLADSGRRPAAFAALARSLVPPVSPRETARRALSMIAGEGLYSRLRAGWRQRAPAPVDPGLIAAGERWREFDARARAFCATARDAAAGQPGTIR